MVQTIEGDQCLAINVSDNREIELDIPDCPFYPVNPYAVDDMTSLHYLHEAGILANLEERSKLTHQTPYTYVANVLIAVNPLRTVPDPNFDVAISACSHIVIVYRCIAGNRLALVRHIPMELLKWLTDK